MSSSEGRQVNVQCPYCGGTIVVLGAPEQFLAREIEADFSDHLHSSHPDVVAAENAGGGPSE
jgi:hypothetical protein